jgi:hypothetical protein
MKIIIEYYNTRYNTNNIYSYLLIIMISLSIPKGGDISGACDMIQDVHVETYGSLSKKEKAEYILQQIRLNLLKKDYVRALIQSRYILILIFSIC